MFLKFNCFIVDCSISKSFKCLHKYVIILLILKGHMASQNSSTIVDFSYLTPLPLSPHRKKGTKG